MFFITRAAAPTFPPRRGRTSTTRIPRSIDEWYRSRVHGAIVAVSLDAGGTLFEAREPVGETYARHARAAGFAVDPADMEDGFRLAFAAAPPLAAPPSAGPAERHAFERAWWRQIVARALDHSLGEDGARAAGARSERLFDGLFAHYATATAWRVFPDAIPTLADLAGRHIQVGILSNFDGRLHRLVADLGLAPYLRVVVPSSEAGAAKPSPEAFASLSRSLGAPPANGCLHVGDSLHEDVYGAASFGWHAAWLQRRGTGEAARGIARIESLSELPGLLDAFDRATRLD
jgi:putative hydrolase of the HAD superfamily